MAWKNSTSFPENIWIPWISHLSHPPSSFHAKRENVDENEAPAIWMEQSSSPHQITVSIHRVSLMSRSPPIRSRESHTQKSWWWEFQGSDLFHSKRTIQFPANPLDTSENPQMILGWGLCGCIWGWGQLTSDWPQKCPFPVTSSSVTFNVSCNCAAF